MGNDQTSTADAIVMHEKFIRAPADGLQRFVVSYDGVRNTLLSFFTPWEVVQAQILSRTFYANAKRIGEIQTRLSNLQRNPLVFSNREFICSYDMASERVQMIFN